MYSVCLRYITIMYTVQQTEIDKKNYVPVDYT